ncbi:SDR family NAD(P)-dependent oxidoreductase [Segetibacter koreensis]|uniref:SDR family NAD(P)-dependent oxidoreductase n=1 Tax=Segetibacter koreensis TaxID=398037 RepID=UPI00037F7C09|nr:SDR family oxidoreductase [Segetibacter koreensis]
MLLKDKNAVIYGAGGSVGKAVAKAFAAEGAKVFLTGRTPEKLKQTVEEIIVNGGYAELAKVDALNEEEVYMHLSSIIAAHQRVDISFNLIGIDDVQGLPLTNMKIDEFLALVEIAMKTQFITATAAAKMMMVGGSGVILMLSANAGKKPYENVGGFGIACAAIEALSRQLAVELGKHGIRVVCLRSAGSPDAAGVSQVFDEHARLKNQSRQEFESHFAEQTMLKHLPNLNEVANVAVIMASAKAAPITAAVVNVTCGELAD